MKADRPIAAVFGVLALGYPALVYFGLRRFSPKAVAVVVGAVVLARLACGSPRANKRRLALLMLPPLTLCAASALCDNPVFLLYVPALGALTMLISFGLTLFRGTSAAETFARLFVSELSANEISYCRSVTQVWTGFFLLNGALALWTARWGSLRAWVLYNGLLAYFGMGALFAAEFVYRHWRFRCYRGLPTDPLLRRLFPPKTQYRP